jgi:proteic killer suppression protein
LFRQKRCRVRWSRKVDSQLNSLPERIQRKFYAWVSAIHLAGLDKVRTSRALHDEPLSGQRRGQRSIRLNISYRAIYHELESQNVVTVEVLEISKHDY